MRAFAGTCSCRSRRRATSCRLRAWRTSAGCPVSAMAAPSASVSSTRRAPTEASRCPSVNLLTSGTQGLQHRLEQLRSNVGVAWRPNVESGWLRTLLGDPEQATLRAGYSVALRAQGMAAFVGVYDDNPGGGTQPHPRRINRHRRTWRNVAGPPPRAEPSLQRPVPGHACLSDCERGESSRRSRGVRPGY